MLTAIREKLTYGNVMATIAVFIALGGVTYAALPKKSVGTKQLKNKSVSTKKLKNKAVTSKKLADKAVGTAKIAGSAVTGSKIASNAVQTSDLGNGVVTRAKVADSAIPFLGTLRSTQELRGSFNLGGTAASPGDQAEAGYSFQFPLENPLSASAVTVVNPNNTTPSCGGLSGGNQQTPLAIPGALCVYIVDMDNLAALDVPSGTFTRLGFGLEAQATAAGDFSASGLWALTAP
jgi:hypothetical protein